MTKRIPLLRFYTQAKSTVPINVSNWNRPILILSNKPTPPVLLTVVVSWYVVVEHRSMLRSCRAHVSRRHPEEDTATT